MKRLIFMTICVLIIFGCVCYANAEEPEINVTLDGKIMIFDQNPIIQNGRVLVPLRKIFESQGAAVSWVPETQSITAVKEGNTVKLRVGLSEAYINDSLITLDQPPVIFNSRTLVPVRFVSEALGAVVEWDSETQSVQIYSKEAEYLSCSALGMIPNDETKGLYNYKILIAAAKKGTKINVNGTYYLQSSNWAYSRDNEVSSCYLLGESPDVSKLILTGGKYFNLTNTNDANKGSVIIENVSIECPTDRASYLIGINPPSITDITFKDNYITGNIEVIDSVTPDNLNYNFVPFSIERLVIENNEFYDVYNNAFRVLFWLEDTPVTTAYIRNNKVTNFSYCFYYNGITDSHAFTNYLIKGSDYLLIENNTVVCTDDYDAVSRNDGDFPVYYCFALSEGFNVECRGNTFEGFHISDAPNTVVYDNYFSVTKLLYENNIWKNIVNFTPGISHVEIMKSKNGFEINGVKTERIYRGNTYIVEPDYADRFGKDRYLLRKEANGFHTDINSIIIEDNYFDMYILSFPYWSQEFKELYKFNRNTVLMDTVEHSIYAQAFAYVKNDPSFSLRKLIFTNNTIVYNSGASDQGVGTKGFYLILNNSVLGDKTTVVFSNNNIKIPDYLFDLSDVVAGSNSSTIINFSNNTINGVLAAK